MIHVRQAFQNLLKGGRDGERAYFDEAYYRASYADVRAAGADGFAHYMAHGWREGRNPSAGFNTLFYRDAHLGGAAVNPLTHYVENGGRRSDIKVKPDAPSAFVAVQRGVVAAEFDADFYRLQAAGGPAADLLTHYLTDGWKQGRSPNRAFDSNAYLARHGFVKALDVSPFYHALSQARLARRPRAKASARKPATVDKAAVRAVVEPAFDRAYYLQAYGDVGATGADPLTHFLDYGWQEARNPTPLFDAAYYAARNAEAVEGLNPFYHYLVAGRAEGRRPNPAGDRLYPPLEAPAPADWDRVTPMAVTAGAEVVVVIPVYKGLGETLASIHAVLAAPQATRTALHVINDRTPDARLDAALAELAGRGLFSYARNAENLGFVRSCNRGLAAFPEQDVVLLNADTRVSGDWVDRMAAHIRRDPSVATVTPLSNNATICSYPAVNRNNLIELEVPAEDLDRMAAACNAGRASDLPTGVGFCFLMGRQARAAVGVLDEAAFGRGYGEENDFCLRAAKAGFRNVLAEDVFVYHAGQVSFAEFTAAEYGPGQAALLAKHPDYPDRVLRHLRADPGLAGRMRLDLARLARQVGTGAVVLVTHALKGGIGTHVAHLRHRLGSEGVPTVTVRVGVGSPWGVEVAGDPDTAPFCPNLPPTGFNQLRPLLEGFLRALEPRAIHVHSLVGFDWVAATGLMALVRGTGVPYYFTLHDYSVVCHRNDLVLTDGRFCGLPAVDACRACVAGDQTYPEAVDPAVRRETYADFLAGAAAVFAPSDDIKRRLERAGAPYAVTVRPHEDAAEPLEPIPRPAGAAVTDVAVVGAVGTHKGSHVLLNLARDARARGLPIRFHVVGYTDLDEDLLAAGVTITGRYRTEGEAVAHLRDIRPALMLLPSIWPETFLYTLSLANRLDLPPVVFDLGAQADRVRETGFGTVLDYGLIDDVAALNDRLLSLAAETAGTPRATPVSYASLINDYYRP